MPRMNRVLVWFSCGRASAVAGKLALEKYGSRCTIAYCASVASAEHPDNRRFLKDCEDWYGRPIKRLHSQVYTDVWDVWNRTRWLVGVGGARCTTELKKRVRHAYERSSDLHVFGLMADETSRINRFKQSNHDLKLAFPLLEAGYTAKDCTRIISEAGIELPAMYKLGYRNNNCIGCVKGQAGYWNKIRKDFPETFWRMAKLERHLNAAICKTEPTINGKRQRIRVFLDELPLDAGRYHEEPAWECGVSCGPQG